MRLLGAIALAIALIGCAESVDVVLDSGRTYTVYGHFSPRSDTQAVRVYAIDQTIDIVRPDPLDAQVQSINLQSGQTFRWRDSVVQFGEFHFGHIFWAPFRPSYDERHRLTLTRPDGAAATVEVVMPPEADPDLVNPVIRPAWVLLPILWRGAPRLNNIRVRYYTNRGTFDFDYPSDQESREDGQLATVLVHSDARVIFREIFRGYGSTGEARLRAIEQFVLVSSEDWVPPGGAFDADILVEPGAFSNVENGYGFVGAGYEASYHYEVPDTVARAAGFNVGGT